MRQIFRVLVLLCVMLPGFLVSLPSQHAYAAPQAQSENWREQRTADFAILYAPGDEQHATLYAGFVDGIYDELAKLFDHRTATPITLRLYPTQESYFNDNPQARQTPGIVAHADFRRRELVVVLPQTEQQSPVEVENNIRHELTHLIASELSNNRLNTGFQEGIAQYMEHPAGELDTRLKLLQRAVNQQALLSWADLDDRDKVYGHPEVAYPETLSLVAFLMEQGGFNKYREFLTTTARASGYRSALERTYGKGADTLEQEWLQWLPSYLGGGFKHSAVNSYDLSSARDLLQQGRYAEAQTELEKAVQWLQANQQTGDASSAMNDAQQLLAQSQQGQGAEQAAADARAALEGADYTRAQELVDQAKTAYAALGDTRQDEVLSAFTERAQRGLAASSLLGDAATQANAFRYADAQQTAARAAAEFDALGDTNRAADARALYRSLDFRQTLLGISLLAVGLAGVIGSLFGRWRMREVEAW